MVDRQVAGRGVTLAAVLDAMRTVPREAFLPETLQEFAYEDSPLPIAEGQTISQPYIVALMTEALELKGGEEVLEIGTGSGYAAAVLSRIARNVYTVERIGQLAEKAAAVLAKLGYANVHVLHADGTRGWPDHAPYDAIVVAAGGPEVPESLKAQLKIGGRLVIPVGIDRRVQELLRVTRVSQHEYKTEDIADVRFVPLVGEEGWAPEEGRSVAPKSRPAVATSDGAARHDDRTILRNVRGDRLRRPRAAAASDRRCARCSPRRSDAWHLGVLSDARAHFARAHRAQGVLVHRHRGRLAGCRTRRSLRSTCRVRALRMDGVRAVSHVDVAQPGGARLRRLAAGAQCNRGSARKRVAFHGLDLYSLYNSIRSVLNYLDDVDPRTARVARERYGCLTPWQSDPATYGHAALTGAYETCEREVVTMLLDLMEKRRAYAEHDGERFLDAVQNARLVANAERYYRIMYYGSRASWNLRDGHMFETLKTLLDVSRTREQGHRLGPQFARRRLCGDRNVFPRRIQHRPSVPQGIR